MNLRAAGASWGMDHSDDTGAPDGTRQLPDHQPATEHGP